MTAILHISSGAIVVGVSIPLVAAPAALIGYVGPGAGLSMLGALMSVVCVIVLALLGPILYPLFAIRSWLRRRKERLALCMTGFTAQSDESGETMAGSDSITQQPVVPSSTYPSESTSTSL